MRISFFSRSSTDSSQVRGARNELCRLYRDLQFGLVDPQVAGRAAHISGILIKSGTDFVLEERIEKLEARLDAAEPNGSTRPGVHP